MLQLALPNAWSRWLLAAIAAWFVTAIVDLSTNTCRVVEFSDVYATIATQGIVDNPRLVAPVAYRFVPPLLVGALNHMTGVPVAEGFALENYIASIALLLLAYATARHLGANFMGGLLASATLVLSIGHIKNNFFFNNPMEAATQALMLAWFLLLLKKRTYWSLLVVCVGLCTREFFLAPAVVTILTEVANVWKSRRTADAARLMLVASVATGAFVLPRLLIHVAGTIQLVDPLNDSGWLDTLLSLPLNMTRNLNFLLSLVGYLLPSLMLLTPARVNNLRTRFAGRGWQLAVYAAIVLPLMYFGGTDLYRYATYLFLPQIVVLALLLQDRKQPVHVFEVVLTLAAVILHNKIFATIPSYSVDPDRYLDFWPGFADRFTPACLRDALLVVGSLGAMTLIRSLAPAFVAVQTAKDAIRKSRRIEPATESNVSL